MSEYGDTDRFDGDGISLWQALRNETVRLDSRKSSSSSQVRKIMTLTAHVSYYISGQH